MADRDLLREARESYARGENVMALFRSLGGTERNSAESVLVSYDLQSGSYRKLVDDPEFRSRHDDYTAAMAAVLDELDFGSVLDAGTGEATALMSVLSKLRHGPDVVAGCDLAWSRVAHGRAHARGFPGVKAPELFVGDLFALPVADGAFDLVFTSHALEPNGGREREAIAELARVSRRWLVLFEPSYELGGDDTRRHVETHGYVRGLPAVAGELGLGIVRHELITSVSAHNRTAALVLRKPDESPARAGWLGCPRCGEPLREVHDQLFCAAEGLVYPVLDGIPCLDPRNAIVASAFAAGL
jgi:SAM-dependent methyltransferase